MLSVISLHVNYLSCHYNSSITTLNVAFVSDIFKADHLQFNSMGGLVPNAACVVGYRLLGWASDPSKTEGHLTH